MPTERRSMRHIGEVLRLHHSMGLSQRALARSLGLAHGSFYKYPNRTRRAGLTWPLLRSLMTSGSRTGCFRHRPIRATSVRGRIGRSAARAPAEERHSDVVVGGALRFALRQFQLFVVLRTPQGMGQPA